MCLPVTFPSVGSLAVAHTKGGRLQVIHKSWQVCIHGKLTAPVVVAVLAARNGSGRRRAKLTCSEQLAHFFVVSRPLASERLIARRLASSAARLCGGPKKPQTALSRKLPFHLHLHLQHQHQLRPVPALASPMTIHLIGCLSAAPLDRSGAARQPPGRPARPASD